jgi:hypothetical protein
MQDVVKMLIMIAEILRKHIKNSGKSRYQISGETGLNESVLCRLMQGTGISDKNADVLCEYFGLELKPKIKSKKR